jgi:alanine dehydrogenase
MNDPIPVLAYIRPGWSGSLLPMRERRVEFFFDDDVRERLTAERAVEAARKAVVDAYEGRLVAPPRLSAEVGDQRLVFTAGGYRDGSVGFRVYGLWPGSSDQAVLVWDRDGSLRACVVGEELGARRTGAIGGVAVDVLARRDAAVVGIVGSGRQAWTQLWAIAAVRSLEEVRVFSPTPANREAFARRARAELGLNVTVVDRAEAAVAGAEIVVLATRSDRPVISSDWISPGTHVTTVGPKTRSAHEIPPELAERAAIVVSDSPAQAASSDEPYFTTRDLTHLGAVASGEGKGRTSSGDVTLFCSTGLAGSEIVVSEALFAP